MTGRALWLSAVDFMGVGVAFGGGILILLQRQRLAESSFIRGWGLSKSMTRVWITLGGILLTLIGIYAVGMSILGWLIAE